MSALAEPWMDDLETQLSAAAGRVSAQLRRRRRSRRVAGLAIAAVLLVGGGALAATTPFHPLASFEGLIGAQREGTAGDVLPADVRQSFAQSPIKEGVDLDQARLIATFPDGARVYAAPRDNGDLCFVYVEGGSGGGALSCGPNLSSSVPITFIIETGVNHPTVVTGLVRDDVRAVSFEIGGELQTVPVKDNAFWYSDAAGRAYSPSFTVEFEDGSTAAYPPVPHMVLP